MSKQDPKKQQQDNQQPEDQADDLLEKIEELEQDDQKENNLIEKLEKDLAEAQVKIEELTNAYARAAADLQNFRRRTEEERNSLGAFANANLILEILPIVDNFERAIEHKPEDLSGDWVDGILQIYEQFKTNLEKQGVQEIKTIGEKCDPNRHEALLQVDGENDIIMQELEKGYLLNNKVIRPAKVAVGNGNIK